jgi:ATP-dependent Clp protease ATP-binding subunit ClpA
VKKLKQNVTPLSPLLSSNVRVATPVKVTPVKETTCVKALQFDDVKQKEEPKKPDSAEECFQKTKQVLQVAQSATVVGRETEVDIIQTFIARNITSRTSASLYISGAPGTGKTAVISNLMAELKVASLVF